MIDELDIRFRIADNDRIGYAFDDCLRFLFLGNKFFNVQLFEFPKAFRHFIKFSAQLTDLIIRAVGPTVLDDVTPDMTHAREEIFGPVASIIRVTDIEEAIRYTNASPFGNAASIYTQSGRSARTFWYRVQAGNIGVNLGIAAAMAYFPFAGQKDSFFGTMHGQGQDAVQFFTDSKVVITRW